MKRITAIILALCLVFSLAGCTVEFVDEAQGPDVPQGTGAVNQPQQIDIGTKTPASPVSTDETWAIYWYLCGSDLESNYGCATNDLIEAFDVALPDNITVVMETGGAKRWHNDTMQSRVLQRYVYSSRGFELVDNLDLANMGNPNTLASFLKFCKDNYPADHTMFLFWDHGGGSVAGVAFDEINNYNSLTLDEIHTAFDTVYDLSKTNPPFELVGFDTCLMATVDMAAALQDISKYMVASEEVEPGGGWYYNDWLAQLAADPSMDGAELGRIICDSYYRGCTRDRIVSKATLSLVDLQQLDGLLEAYEAFGDAVLMASAVDSSFTNRFARTAVNCESYGGNTREQGYTNMVDLGHVARSCSGLLHGADDVTKALEKCVLYQIKGQYKSEASGLSFFFPFVRDMKTYNAYTGISASRSFPFFYEYALTGKLDEAGLSYLESLNGAKEVETPKTLLDTDWQGKSLTVNEEGSAVLTLGPEADKLMSGISFSLYYSDDKSGNVLCLGTDNDIWADWENGVFTDNFRGVWGAFGGQLVYMELSYEGDDYNTYAVPVMINGEAYKLEVVYDFNDEEWTVIGARKPIDANGMADKNMYMLEEGDEIDIVWYIAASGKEDLTPYTVGSFTYDEDTVFEELWLPDGTYTLVFEMRDAGGNTITSAEVDCRIVGEDMFMEPR